MIDQPKRPNAKSRGFTIVELMISLSILSTILLISTVLIMQIGRLYTKGINAANLQNTTRTIQADIVNALQFSGTAPSPCALTTTTYCSAQPTAPYQLTVGTTAPNVYQVNSYCIGTIRYSYVMNRELGTDPNDPPGGAVKTTPHVLWRDTLANENTPCTPVDISMATPAGNGYEMAADHMRLTRFLITPLVGSTYNSDVWLAYGDYDLLAQTATPGLFNCKTDNGNQFCGFAQNSAVITGRKY